MATSIREIVKWYIIINEDWSDTRNNERFLLNSPWPSLTLLGLYTYFIYDFGPRFMAKRQPFKLDRIIQLYNIFQVLINAYICYKILDLGWLRGYNFFCEPVDYSYTPKTIEIARVLWIYFLVKVIDLLDTIFFILRKKQNQVTFLHVYHHGGMVILCWLVAKFIPGGHVTFTVMLNTFVHSVMYAYYLLASMKISTNSWKKYITQLQLVQFFLVGVHDMQLFWVENCDVSVWVAYIIVPQNVFIIILFGDFYYKTYIKKKTGIKTMPIKTITKEELFTEISNKKPKML
ncbi:very long chain fatty acid elongase 7-like [Linepithema humile]|uniref:very long chain fatty acid elongase 7-like n=1 Tax=Linepithema humile TaxID=83485 RepID=UPI0006238185|nr:PREDICTED: elongation of very long chain fatty acids protein 7-like [Linepithema humile]